MIDKTINACTNKLYSEFGSGYTLYVDAPDQNFKTPSFIVDVINPMQERKRPFSLRDEEGEHVVFRPAMMYYRIMPTLIQYFPKDKKGKHECLQVAERIFNTIEEITIDGKVIRGADFEMQITEDVLQIFVTYRFYTMKVEGDYETFETVYTDITNKN